MTQFNRKKPCANCPFLAEGAISLREGRVEGIVESLMDDHTVFHCHKSVYSKRGGHWEEGEDGEESRYVRSGDEEACAGALAYMLREHQQTPVLLRVAVALGKTTYERYQKLFPRIRDRLNKEL